MRMQSHGVWQNCLAIVQLKDRRFNITEVNATEIAVAQGKDGGAIGGCR